MTPAEFIDNPAWAHFLPESRESAKTRHLPTHEDCASLDVETVATHLMRGGTLGRWPRYEERPGQIDMLRAVVRAYNRRENLMIEAGTGVGKSLAYLIPSILWSWTNDTPVVISTATRNLQSQLVNSDIPKAVAVLGDDAPKFRVALLKGRANYLCLRALGEFFAPGYWTMTDEEQAEMPHFIHWLETTEDGDLDAYEGLPRNLLTCPGEECGGRRCPFYSRCFIYRARRRAASAHLVIANHALVLAEATSAGGAILPAYARLVLDEAHNLEDIATEYMSAEFSIPALMRLLNRLSRRSKGKKGARARASGILSAIERQWQKGVLSGSSVGEAVHRALGTAPNVIVRVVNAAEDLAEMAARLLRPGNGLKVVRYRMMLPEAGLPSEPVRAYALHGLFRPYAPGDWDEAAFAAAEAHFESELAALVNLLHTLRDLLNDSVPPGEFNFCADLAVQVEGIAESFVAFANEANFALSGAKETHAYWVERVTPEKFPSYVRLVAAPLSVADDLRRLLYEQKDSTILSSATLRVGNDFHYMAKRLGFFSPESAEEAAAPQAVRYRALTAASPFDYLRQALVLAPDFLPDPTGDGVCYARALAGLLGRLLDETHGRALVLFTSYEMMRQVAQEARESFEAAGLELLVQGEGASRESMTHALKSSSSASRGVVLFGAQSFWEGVDVAGEALSCVVLARLPFAQMGDPIVEARSEKIDREGGNSFRDYSLPEAVIKFRQGFGRLIRTRQDRGVVVVADPRLVTKNYGRMFVRSLPTSVHTVTDESNLLARVRSFLELE